MTSRQFINKLYHSQRLFLTRFLSCFAASAASAVLVSADSLPGGAGGGGIDIPDFGRLLGGGGGGGGIITEGGVMVCSHVWSEDARN